MPVGLATAALHSSRQKNIIAALSLPALETRDMAKTMQEIRKRGKQLAASNKLEQERLRKDRKREKRRQKEARRVALEMQKQHESSTQQSAALVIQKIARSRNGQLDFQKKKCSLTSAVLIQRVVRLHMSSQKAQTHKVDRARKKVAMWQALTTIVISLVRWLKRSRDQRWMHFTQAVKQVCQGEELREDWGLGGNRSRVTIRKKQVGHKPNHRRESSISAITAYHSEVAGKGATVQRVSIVETDRPNTLAVEICQIATKVTTVIEIEHFMIARLGIGKLEDMSWEQRDNTCRTLLDCCLMQTGRTSAMSLFDQSPTLCTFFKDIFKVIPKFQRENPKTLADIFTERLRVQLVKKGTTVFEQGQIGHQMWFVRTGKIELLQPKIEKADRKKEGTAKPKKGGLALEPIAQGKRRPLPAGISENGSVPAHFGILARQGLGIVETEKLLAKKYFVAHTLGPGGQFGELGMLQGDKGPRCATAIAAEDTEMLSLHEDDLTMMIKYASNPADVISAVSALIFSWIQSADCGECDMTPDLKKLRMVVTNDPVGKRRTINQTESSMRVTKLEVWWKEELKSKVERKLALPTPSTAHRVRANHAERTHSVATTKRK
jgi:CRP-like cAMP-binding protein